MDWKFLWLNLVNNLVLREVYKIFILVEDDELLIVGGFWKGGSLFFLRVWVLVG